MKAIYIAFGLLLFTVSCKEAPKPKPVDPKKLEAARKKDSADHTPEKLIAKVWNEVYYEHYENIKAIADTIRKRHPNAPELKTADSLVALSEEMIAERTASWEKAFKGMKVKTDDVSGSNTYKDPSSPSYINQNAFYLTFDKFNRMYLRIQYYGDDWLFIKSYSIKTDWGTYELVPDEVERDNESSVWEWSTISVGPKNCEMLNAVRNSKSVTIRSNGKQYYKDRKLSSKEIKAIDNVMKAFWHNGGKHCR
jgi:hypothetical protein